MDERSQSLVKYTPRDELTGGFHFGWGMQIRNGFGLWGRNALLLDNTARRVGRRSIHPDEASSVIIEAVWERLQARRIPQWLPPLPTVIVDSLVVVSSPAGIPASLLRRAADSLARRTVYPQLAQLARLQGKVEVDLMVTGTGEVSEVMKADISGADVEAPDIPRPRSAGVLTLLEQGVEWGAMSTPLFEGMTGDFASRLRAYVRFELKDQAPVWPDE